MQCSTITGVKTQVEATGSSEMTLYFSMSAGGAKGVCDSDSLQHPLLYAGISYQMLFTEFYFSAMHPILYAFQAPSP